MKIKIFLLLLFVFALNAGAQTVNDLQQWKKKLKNVSDFKTYVKLREEFEKKFKDSPQQLLNLYKVYFYRAYDVFSMAITQAKTKQEKQKLVKLFSRQALFNNDSLVFIVADVASRVDTIYDDEVRDFARRIVRRANEKRFYKKMKEQGAPDFSFVDLNGKSRSFFEFKGRYVLLHFWNRRSVPCVEELAILKKAQKTFSKKLAIVSVHLNIVPDPMEQEIVKALIQEMDLQWTNIIGPQSEKLKQMFYVENFPTMFLFDPNLRLLFKRTRMEKELQPENLLTTLHKTIR